MKNYLIFGPLRKKFVDPWIEQKQTNNSPTLSNHKIRYFILTLAFPRNTLFKNTFLQSFEGRKVGISDI